VKKFQVRVVLVFEGIEARSLEHARELAEGWCHPLPREVDAFRSYGERIHDEKEQQEAQGVQGV